MQVPQMTLVSSVTQVSSVDVILHEVVGLSWHVLLPYTLFGAGLMAYSQLRLTWGQHVMAQEKKSRSRKRASKRFLSVLSLPNIWVVINRLDIQRSR